MVTTKFFLAALACGLLAMAAASQLRADASDVPITGGALFAGGASASFPTDMTIINFSNNCFFLTGSGTFGGIPQTPATFTSFCFTGDGANAVLCAPVPMLWAFTFGGNSYSFNLLHLAMDMSNPTRWPLPAQVCFSPLGLIRPRWLSR